MTVEFLPILVETGGPDRDGRLALIDGALVAIAVRIEDVEGGAGWSVEWLGSLIATLPGLFDNLDTLAEWLTKLFHRRD